MCRRESAFYVSPIVMLVLCLFSAARWAAQARIATDEQLR